tara:strand:+ start:48 stop:635 length:588 start_codon:yes stop_codon:yes gene_type:complete
MVKKCLMCDDTLEVGTNWYTCMMKKKHYRCIPCDKKVKAVSNPTRMYVNGKHIRKTHPLYKPGRYKTFNDAAFAGTYKLDYIKEGYVYVITNKAWPEWVKIGMAIDAEDRLNGYQTSSPMRDFVLEYSITSNDRRKSEKEAHTRALPLATDSKGEWFKISVQQAITILDNLDEQHRTPSKANTHKKEDELQGSLF